MKLHPAALRGGGCAAQLGLGHAGERLRHLQPAHPRRRRGLPLFEEGLPLFTQAPHKFLQGRSHAFAGVGVGVGSRRQKCHRITPPTQGPPPPRIAALPLRLWPHAKKAGQRGNARRHNAAKNLPSAGSKNSRPAGRFFGRQGQIVTKRFGNFFCHRRGKGRGNFRDLSLICHKGLFRPLISIFLGTLNPLFIRRVRPPGLEPGTN